MLAGRKKNGWQRLRTTCLIFTLGKAGEGEQFRGKEELLGPFTNDVCKILGIFGPPHLYAFCTDIQY